MPTELNPQSLLAKLDAQDRVRDFLERAVRSGRTAQSYLFVGAPGAGKLDAAWGLAQALLCDRDEVVGACASCDSCIRVARHTHPDVHYYAPESATGYLVSQVRELLDDVALAPIRAGAKVYIVDRAEQLRANTANALLKTIEEPPEGITFILLGTSTDTILPTIVSRCQCVPFRMPSPAAATQAVMRATGLPQERCRMAVSVAGSPARAVEFLKSADRQDVRRQSVHAIDALEHADEADVLKLARDLTALIIVPKKMREAKIKEVQEANADFLSRGALKQLEDRTKREINARERSGIMESLACVRSLLRDVLTVLENVDGGIANEDARDTVERLARQTTPAGVLAAIDAVSAAQEHVARNITPQLAIEVMLFDIRKALKCR